jgi:hypothetical protein
MGLFGKTALGVAIGGYFHGWCRERLRYLGIMSCPYNSNYPRVCDVEISSTGAGPQRALLPAALFLQPVLSNAADSNSGWLGTVGSKALFDGLT